MDKLILRAAMHYHNEGLNVIPVTYKAKKPALATWEEYFTRHSTEDEIKEWFSNGKEFNIGLVHCQLKTGQHYSAIDIDHDSGILDSIKSTFPYLVAGRIEQSGSREGYHIPIILDARPDFGYDTRKQSGRGNRTWKTDKGDVNIRTSGCQTVAPPSVHPTGNRYRFLQKGSITQLPTLDSMIEWLDQLAPPVVKEISIRKKADNWTGSTDGENLVDAVKNYWSNCLLVFDYFGMALNVAEDKDEWRLLGNGGLMVPMDNLEIWYCFGDEIGGGIFEAWGWQRFGSRYDKRAHFRQVLVEMAQVAGIDVAQYYQRGDEKKLATVQESTTDRQYWTRKYQVWSQMR